MKQKVINDKWVSNKISFFIIRSAYYSSRESRDRYDDRYRERSPHRDRRSSSRGRDEYDRDRRSYERYSGDRMRPPA